MRSAWQLRCPKGHSSIDSRGTGYRCRSCDVVYEGDAYNAKTTEFPVDDVDDVETRDYLDVDEVLSAMVAAADRREWSHAGHLSHLGRQSDIGVKLRMLHQRGLIERYGNADSPYLWRVTERGFDVAESDGLRRDNHGRFIEAQA